MERSTLFPLSAGVTSVAAHFAVRLAGAEQPERLGEASLGVGVFEIEGDQRPVPAASPDTCGCSARKAAMRLALALCRLMRRGSVSTPWMSWNTA